MRVRALSPVLAAAGFLAAASLSACEEEVKQIDRTVIYRDGVCTIAEEAAIHFRSIRSNLAYELWIECEAGESRAGPERLVQVWDPEFFSIQIEATPGLQRVVVFFCPDGGEGERQAFERAAAAFAAENRGLLKARLVGAYDNGSCPGATGSSGARRKQNFRNFEKGSPF